MRVFYCLTFLLIFMPSVLMPVQAPVMAAEIVYICPMHPHIEGKEGDLCPICGMALVPLDSETPADMKMSLAPADNTMTGDTVVSAESPGQGAVHISPRYRQALGVDVVAAEEKVFGRNIRAYGEVTLNTRGEYKVNMRTEGWIVDLATDAVGDTVEKGDLLFTYYSPDLMAAQRDILIGRTLGDTTDRLRLFGMDEKAIAEFQEREEFFKATPFYAPFSGTVRELTARKGSFIEAGDRVLTLQDFSTVWVEADVPIRDMQYLEKGQHALITVPETGKIYHSGIDFIHHVADLETRTGMVRLVIPHDDLEPKPGTFVDVVFHAKEQTRLAVPREAVLYGADGAYVIQSLGDGYFRPAPVETGVTANGYTEIQNGLKAGQEIVRSGQFMIDAESSLRGGMAAMGHGTHDQGESEVENKHMNETEDSSVTGGHQHE